jgi:hypothetical protein
MIGETRVKVAEELTFAASSETELSTQSSKKTTHYNCASAALPDASERKTPDSARKKAKKRQTPI